MNNTKKIAMAAFLSFAVMAAAPKAQAAGDAGVVLSFGAGFYQAVDDRRINGYNSNFGLDFTLDEGTKIGLYREDLNIEAPMEIEDIDGDQYDTIVDTDISVDITEVRVTRTVVPDLVDVILGFGGASIKAALHPSNTKEDYSTISFDREVPVIDLLGRITAINTNGKKINSKLYVDLGYRFMDIRDIDTYEVSDWPEDAVNDVKIDDLSGFFGNLGASVQF